MSYAQDLSITFHFVYVYCTTFNCTFAFCKIQNEKMSKNFEKLWIIYWYKNDIFKYRVLCLKTKNYVYHITYNDI